MINIAQKIKLAAGLLSGNRAKNGPFYVDIDLTERCNLNCLGCAYHNVDNKLIWEQKDVPQDIPMDLFKRICTELKNMGTHTLIFQGTGEPFLHPHLIECVHIGKELGFFIILYTNGTLLSRDIIRELSEEHLDRLKISLWATSREQFAQNYPGTNPAVFQKVLDGLQQLGKLRAARESFLFEVQTHFIINTTNYFSVDEMIDLAELAGSCSISFSPMVNLRKELDPLILSSRQINQFQKSLRHAQKRIESLNIEPNIDEITLRYNLGPSVWKSLPCYVTWYHSRVRADGTIQPCGRCFTDVQFGNVHTKSFQEIWNGSPMREFRAKTRTTEGLASLQGSCSCRYCCFVKDNHKIHNVMKWLSPFSARENKKYHDAQ
ncbi:MAG: radical SAM protein [Candidatus Aminicenantes bacterium]|jgi:radical SAM protein with 4Fe4S-binding SPASM domain